LTKCAEGLGLYGYYPTPATIVTSKSGDRENAMAVAWHAVFSLNPPTYGVSISPKRFTYELIRESRAFAVNFMPGKEAELVAAVGGCSGRDVDKFKELGIRKVKGLVLDVPVIETAYFAIECEIGMKISSGDHDWFVGNVVATHWSDEAFDDEGLLRLAKVSPTMYLGSDNYLIIGKGRRSHHDRKACVVMRKRKVK